MPHSESDAVEIARRSVARRYWLRPPFRAIVTNVDSDARRYARTLTRIVRYQVEWDAEPYSGRKKLDVVPVAPGEVSPLTQESPGDLRDRSEHFATCGGCHGQKKVMCSTCSGHGRLRCGQCRGSGNQRSEKTGKIINCRSCRGRGDVDCSNCSKGKVQCWTCSGTGKLRKWLVVRDYSRDEVLVSPQGTHLSGHDGIAEASNRAQSAHGVVLLSTAEAQGLLNKADMSATILGDGVPTSVDQLQPAVDSTCEVVTRQKLESYLAQIWTVEFAASGRQGHLTHIEGLPNPVDADLSPIISWRRWLAVSSVLALSAVFFAWVMFYGRDPAYFSRSSFLLPFLMAATVAASSFVAAIAVWRVDPRLESWRKHAIGAVGTSAGALVSAAVLFFASVPTAADVQEFAAAGNLREAKAELAALKRSGEVGPDIEEAKSAFSDARRENDLDLVEDHLKRQEHQEAARELDKIVAAYGSTKRVEELRDVAQKQLTAQKKSDAERVVKTALANVEAAEAALETQAWRDAASTTNRILEGDFAKIEPDFRDKAYDEALARANAVAIAAAPKVADLDLDDAERLANEARAEKSLDLAARKVSLAQETLAKVDEGVIPERRARVAKRVERVASRVEKKQKAAQDARLREMEREQKREESRRRAEERRIERARKAEERRAARRARCCKICTKGKACGDSCISRSYTCRKGPGCACDG